MPKSSSLQRGDDRLQVVALLARHPELVALGLGLDALEAEALDELVELLGLVGGDAGGERDDLADGAPDGFLDLAVVERLQRDLALDQLLLEHLAQGGQPVLAGGAQRDRRASPSSIDESVSLKSKRLATLALSLVDGVADLLLVDLGDDVEAGHGQPGYPAAPLIGRSRCGGVRCAARYAHVTPGRCPSGQRELAVNQSAQPTEVRILPGPPSLPSCVRGGVRVDAWSLRLRSAP